MTDKKSYLSFIIGSEYYAANVRNIQNIIEYRTITKVPEMPRYMLGIINLRGIVLPVIDLRIIFNLENTERTINTCILVMDVQIEGKEVFVGALVDGVAEVLEIKDSELNETPNIGTTIRNELITGVYHDAEKFIIILEMNKVFSEDKLIGINELA